MDVPKGKLPTINYVKYLGGHPDREQPVQSAGTVTVDVEGIRFKVFRELLVIRWSEIDAIAVEGTEQVDRRVSGGRVVAFGVLGAMAKKGSKTSYLVVTIQGRDVLFEAQRLGPHELRGKLSAVLAAAPTESPEPNEAGDDPMARLRGLAVLRDEGVITAEDFEAKKAELLKRI
jgi:hypothetical protein